MRWRVIADERELELLAPQWDALAARCRRPFAGPAWLLAWWRHARPRDARLHAVAVEHDGALVGMSPWWSRRTLDGAMVLRPLGGATADRIETLALPGARGEVARATATALAAPARVAQVEFEAQDPEADWPRLLAEAWQGERPVVRRGKTARAPVVDLTGGGYDDWFMGKTSHFRQRMRKLRRDFERRGGVFRLANAATVDHDLAAFARVHRAGWEARGGSRALTQGVEAVLRDAARDLLPQDRFRLWSLETDGEVVSSHILVRAGGEIAYWLTGWDPSRQADGLSLLGILNAIEDAFALGADRVQLGEGDMAYKYRFATSEDELRWSTLIPQGPSSALAHARLLWPRARGVAGRRLPDRVKTPLRRALPRG